MAKIKFKIITNAKQTQVVGKLGEDTIKLKLSAQPVDGKANEALIKFLSKSLKVSKADIKIASGLTSKEKLIDIQTLTTQEIFTILGA